MSCRRRDRENLIGCNVGEVALRGCSRECCPYPDSEIFQHTHAHLMKGDFCSTLEDDNNQSTPAIMPPGRTNLRFQYCESPHSHRPKFICPKPGCRKVFKPFYDPDRFEYRISRYEWSFRPRVDINEELRAAERGRWRNRSESERRRLYELAERHHRASQRARRQQRKAEGDEDEQQVIEPLTEAELAELKANDPEAWWTTLISAHSADDHMKRCPSCGESGIRVGSNFRAPSKHDDKAWAALLQRMMVDDDDSSGTTVRADMMAEFEFCPTVEQWREMAVEAERRKKRMARDEEWQVEKRRRIAALGLGSLG